MRDIAYPLVRTTIVVAALYALGAPVWAILGLGTIYGELTLGMGS